MGPKRLRILGPNGLFFRAENVIGPKRRDSVSSQPLRIFFKLSYGIKNFAIERNLIIELIRVKIEDKIFHIHLKTKLNTNRSKAVAIRMQENPPKRCGPFSETKKINSHICSAIKKIYLCTTLHTNRTEILDARLTKE